MKYGSKKPLAGLPSEKLHPYRKYGNVMKKAPSPQFAVKNQMHPMQSEEAGEKRKDKEKGEL